MYIFIFCDCGAADEVAVTPEIFCGAVHDNVGPKLQRVLKIRAHEGVVYDEKGVSFLANLTHLSNVYDPHQWIGRCLYPDEPGVLPYRLLDTFRILRIYVCELQPVLTKHLVE